jgi:hypothetical protein
MLFAGAVASWCSLVVVFVAGRGCGLCVMVLVALCGAVRGKQGTHDPAPQLDDTQGVRSFEGIVRATPERRPRGSRVPIDLFDVGFQLSFGATAGILLLYRPIRRALPMKDQAAGRFVFDSLAVSLAAQVGTLPIVMGTWRRLLGDRWCLCLGRC